MVAKNSIHKFSYPIPRHRGGTGEYTRVEDMSMDQIKNGLEDEASLPYWTGIFKAELKRRRKNNWELYGR